MGVESENDPDSGANCLNFLSKCKIPPAADHLTGGF